MRLMGSGNQQRQDYLYRNDLTLTGLAQLVMGRSMSRSYLLLQNTGNNVMYLEIGSGAAHATLTSSVVTSITVDNVGFGYSVRPLVLLLGGGYGGNTSTVGLTQPNWPAPSHPAVAHCVMTGAVGSQTISSITVDDGGTNYAIAPYVHIRNNDLDPNGCAVPAIGTGIQLQAGSSMLFNGTATPTDPIAVIGTSGDKLICRWMD